MLSEKAKTLFAALELPFSPVAVKFHYRCPENVPHTDETLSLCQFVKKAQTENRDFYITASDENCSGRIPLGMADKDGFHASGQVGYDFEIFRTPAANARIHAAYPVLPRDSVRYVEFCPVALCGFDPDLVICVTDTRQADILMRASSYISGDLWESRTSAVVSCAWTYVYPYLSGKVNFCTTGMHHGMKRRGVYPAGLHVIAIPYQKLDEIVTALGEMPWVPIAFREDAESREILASRMADWE